MSRSLRLIGVAVSLLWLGSSPAQIAGAEHATNVVLIISDDQSFGDFGFMGHRLVRTPNLDRLASQAARFTHGYVPASVCRPSLASLLTGRYPHQHGIHFNHPPPGFAKLTKTPTINKQQYDALRDRGAALIRDQLTLPRLLTARGYRCLQTGKYWEGHYRNAGFSDGMTTAQPSGGKYGDKRLANGDLVAHGNGDHGLVIGRQTMKPIADFLDACGSSPFFIWYAPLLPHTPHDAPQRFCDQVPSAVADFQRPYFASIAQFDEGVGQLMELVDQRGKTANTLFVLVVDNGWQPDEHRFIAQRSEWDHTKRSKRAPFDAGLRTPILFRLDGETVSATIESPVSSIDIFPTILSALKIDSKDLSLPGVDLWDVATGRATANPDRAVCGAIYPGDASVLGDPAADVAYRWIRQGAHKLIVPVSRPERKPWNHYLDSPALFDVVHDPEEANNLIDHAVDSAIAEQLHRKLNRWWSPATKTME